MTHVLADKGDAIHHTGIVHLLNICLDNHLSDTTSMELRGYGQRVDGNGPAALLVTDFGGFATKGSPVFGVVHVGIRHALAAATGGYYVSK